MSKDNFVFRLEECRLIQHSTVMEALSNVSLKELFSVKRKSGLAPKDFLKAGCSERDILFASENKDIWLSLARSEWKHTKTKYTEKKKPCDLCNTPHKVMCYVTNDKNGNILNVGGTCVGIFGDEVSRRHLNGVKSEKELNNLAKIQKAIPKIKSLSSKWSKFADEIYIIPPNRLMNQYLAIGDQIEETLKRGIKNSDNKSEIEKLQELINKGNTLKDKMNKFSEENSCVDFILNRDLLEEMRRVQPVEYVEIKNKIVDENSSRVSWATAHRIKAHSFLENFKEAFNSKNIGINIVELRGGKYIIQFDDIRTLYFQISTKSFILNCGDIVFNHEDTPTQIERIEGMVEYLDIFGGPSQDKAIELISNASEQQLKYKRYNPRKDFDLNGQIKQELSQLRGYKTMKNEVTDTWAELDRLNYEAQKIARINNKHLNQDASKDSNLLSMLSSKPNKILIFNTSMVIVHLRKIREIYHKIGSLEVAQDIEILERNIDFMNKSSSAAYQKIRATTVFKSDAEIAKDEERLKDSIINFDKYNGTTIDFIDSDNNMIVSVEKGLLCQHGTPLIFSKYVNKKVSLDRLNRFLEGVKKITKEQYRKNILISIESSRLEI
ncbi:hypothetical protein HCB25_03640 [Listeria booriae]|uniref:Uncharacterized protein n=1 Tax=Listeria booriae TaxID=1552123 RepID=A0A842EYE7_9LIST|nr:hypothetical protein [Listeria booriae]MBC2243147.1 hypothetical protein [Listeria booriae]